MNEIIINGGNPLPGCPASYFEALGWAREANAGKEVGPYWSFDCGLKLDFDGELLSISSRFYPPKESYGSGWNGAATLYFLGEIIESKEFAAKTLDELKIEVEEYTRSLTNRLKASLNLL
jgi:hypothetical protein